MNTSIVRTLPAAVALAVACIAGSAVAQTAAPTTTQKVENAGEKAWDATKSGTEKAWDKTKAGSEKAWDATKSGTKKAVKATEKGAKATGKAVDNVATDAADGTRKVGNKIGEKIPGTAQHDAAKKP
ncbi:hypothetical protein QTH87_08775 [Variovorax sp. J22P168]|uniref:hypothetical protein n=1 Tax=Variovorax jilinensis TaxID=3053513 RepID=UPI0025751DF3|nr:hypothetical protein [Variovorax sp. J22P168]MDM0012525.1 hypothetical protein [Variovorax sp. J22P168]